MAGFFRKLFGGGSKASNGVEKLASETLEGLLERSALDLTFETKYTSESEGGGQLHIEFSGADEEILKDRKGQVLDSMQLFLKRVIQHHLPEDRTNLTVDCGGYREENEAALIERAESLKTIALEEGKSVYYRALPPKERKIVHQYLAKDPRVKSRSLGDGLYKKIKIYPSKNNSSQEDVIQE